MDDKMLSGMIGLAVADALGSPVQFMDREELRRKPVTEMMYCEIYDKPAGAWTDDTSMALCILDSLRTLDCVDVEDIMDRFVQWMHEGAYTPTGVAFDEGNTCISAIERFRSCRDADTCGRTGEHANGNGSLMRTLPLCIYLAERVQAGDASVEDTIRDVHKVGALTHNHLRACMGCGLYYFCVSEVMYGAGDLRERLQKGLDCGFAFYGQDMANLVEMSRYGRLRDLTALRSLEDREIRSSGYVVDTLEAAIWSLVTTDSYRDAVLRAVNLGEDTDTVGAVAGGLAGLYYGYNAIPSEWRTALLKRTWIENLCG